MPSLLTDFEKTALDDVFDSLHDTWARDIQVYKESKTIFVDEPLDSPFYHRPPQANTERVHKTLKARIYHYTRSHKNLNLSPEMAGQIETGEVRIKISASDLDFFKDVERVIVYNGIYAVSSSPIPVGLFSVKHYIIALKKVEEE